MKKYFYKINFSFLCAPIDIVLFFFIFVSCVRVFWRHILVYTLLTLHNLAIAVNFFLCSIPITLFYLILLMHSDFFSFSSYNNFFFVLMFSPTDVCNGKQKIRQEKKTNDLKFPLSKWL